jgi:superfamily II DNA or RNA helicase
MPFRARQWALSAERLLFSGIEVRTDFLCVATPGAGKTMFAGAVARRMLLEGRVRRIVVVVPSTRLKKQWAHALSRWFGIELDWKFENAQGMEEPEFDGVVMTYAQTASQKDLHRRNSAVVATLVICDEIHHAADEKSWGGGIRTAFEPAPFRLLLSGTPFREDNCPIPFVRYEQNRSVADFSYSYGEALADDDHVCRSIYFPSFEARATWLHKGKEYQHTFSDKLGEELAAQRLRTVLEPDSDWIGNTLRQAHERLLRIRGGGNPRAGGLVVAMSAWHADALARQLHKVSGQEVVVVKSEDADAQERLDAFASGDAPWCVSIRMVTEGVDIPRCCVGVFATNIGTELFFRQFVGRFVRWQEELGENQGAYLYLPADAWLLRFAEQIKQERDHQLKELIEQAKQAAGDGDEPAAGGGGTSSAIPLGATPMDHDVIWDGLHLQAAEFKHAEEICRRFGFALGDAGKMAMFLREQDSGTEAPPTSEGGQPEAPSETLRERRDRLAGALNKAANRLCGVLGWEYKHFNAQLNTYMGVTSRHEAMIRHLQRGLEEVTRLMEEHGVSL